MRSALAADGAVARSERAACAPDSDRALQERARRYAPYAVDWRFLPNEILYCKDFIRHYLAIGSNSIAKTRELSPLWVATIGRNIAKTISNAGILFVHIPKTGGTSISKVLYNRNLPHYTAQFWYGAFGQIVRDLPSFAVIRHPAERLVSTYKMAVAGGTEIVAYSRYRRARLQGLDSLESFVDHLFDNRTRLATLSADLREQADFVLDAAGRVVVDRLFSLDARRGLPAELGRWLAIPALPHLNATPPIPLHVTRAAGRKIAQIYHRDFEIYRRVMASGGAADMRGLNVGDISAGDIRPNRRPALSAR